MTRSWFLAAVGIFNICSTPRMGDQYSLLTSECQRQPEHEAHHSVPCSVDTQNMLIFTSSPLFFARLLTVLQIKYKFCHFVTSLRLWRDAANGYSQPSKHSQPSVCISMVFVVKRDYVSVTIILPSDYINMLMAFPRLICHGCQPLQEHTCSSCYINLTPLCKCWKQYE